MDEREALFWRFVRERQSIYERRRRGESPPWTGDRILNQHKFTNVYRAADRYSQYLINEVQYVSGAFDEGDELVFRSLLFRIFNLPETYAALREGVYHGEHPTLWRFDPDKYAAILDMRVQAGLPIWGGAYMITPPHSTYGTGLSKHRAWLRILYDMVSDGVPQRVLSPGLGLSGIYKMFRAYPTVGDFFAFQWTIDVNYSAAVDYEENTFVVPGSGAVRGAQKLGYPASETRKAIHNLTWNQESGLGPDFPWLGGAGDRGRRLRLIDIQNCLCEFDKYTRMARPEWSLGKHFNRIKHGYSPSEAHRTHSPLTYRFPPKWGLGPGWEAEDA